MSAPPRMPLEQARELLRGVTRFVKGEGQLDGQPVLAADLIWDALLSLADAAELVEVASRLDWQFHPRGFDNTELHARYGDGIVPWLATRLDQDGVLHNLPWCVVPCLLACASDEAFALAWRTRDIAGRTAYGGCGPDGDLVATWCQRHPEVGRAALERLAPGDARARAYLRGLWGVRGSPETAADVLALLDACAARLLTTRVALWPPGDAAGLRLVAARDGGDWGIALERVEGTRPSGFMAAQVLTWAYGSRVRGAADGATQSARPVPELGADDLDVRLGPPALALPALGLPATAVVVASVPHLALAKVPSETEVLATLAERLVER